MQWKFLPAGWLYVVAILAVALTCWILLRPPRLPTHSLADDAPATVPAGARSW
jgi:hypothetical protein